LPVRWVVLLMLAPGGIWFALRGGRRDPLFILLAFAGLYSAATVLFFICDRYRYPLWPAMAVLAGGGVWACAEALHRRRPREIAGLAAGMALMAAAALPNWAHARLPSFARDYLFRSMAGYEKGRFPEALDDIERSVALDPTDATALHHRGNVLFALGRVAEAGQAYEQALARGPGEAGIWNNLGAVRQALGQTDGALDALRRATECRPPSKKAFVGMAILQIRADRTAEAAATLDRLDLLDRTPDAAALALRSVIARRQGNASQADVLERQARALDAGATDWAIRQAEDSPDAKSGSQR
jgi:Flp pilus assembly protein TadD